MRLKTIQQDEKNESIINDVLPIIDAPENLALINNPFKETECATPKEINYFNNTVPELKNIQFKAKIIFKASKDG